MMVLPPGTLLQLMYLRERLGFIKPGRFIEIGPGAGEITKLLLDLGWEGQSYDLEAVTTQRLRIRFSNEIEQGRYSVINADYLSQSHQAHSVDLVISCMVMEHLEDDLELLYMQSSLRILRPGGLMVGLVPGSPAHWGIEDDIAGHCRRYTRARVQSLITQTGWTVEEIVGLTFPVSNLLLPLSNFLVSRSEKSKINLSALDRTKFSGRRHVKFKTHFPSLLGLLLNRYALWPFHMLQKIFQNSDRALVIYFECRPIF